MIVAGVFANAPALTRAVRLGLVLSLTVWLVAGCSGQANLAGTYHAKGNDGIEAQLVLQDGGKGSWSTDEADVDLTWERKGDEVWLHTRSGGVLPGTILDGGNIHVDLPGVGDLTFRRGK